MFISNSPIKSFFIAFSSLLSYVSAAGWTLDSSCGGELGGKVRESMNLAFQMATDAATELGRTPVREEVLEVYRHLFLDTEEVRDTKVRAVFQSISGMSQEVPKDINDESTVIMYCDFKRIQPGATPGSLYDTDFQMDMDDSPQSKKDWELCQSSNPVKQLRPYTQALTSAERRKTSPRASQIQICPWYLDHSFHLKFDESKGYMKKRIAAKLYETLWASWKDKEIDGLATFPVTMLHELAHTLEAGVNGLMGGTTGDDLGYTWKEITKETRLGHTNADNYAYFGLAINRMKDTNDPRMVQADGKMREMATSLARRFLQALEWLG